ncbi:MAG: hypothetical protein KatS3mg082_0019 [Nitrospiraceae bacterium]|nr:MAG: hypothetical protein KatS3mg082_0019 [Nitrospiraceae bacterium]
MADQSFASDTALRITSRFSAPREKVFRACTDPEALKRWFVPSDDYSIPHAAVDLRLGGTYHRRVRPADRRRLVRRRIRSRARVSGLRPLRLPRQGTGQSGITLTA